MKLGTFTYRLMLRLLPSDFRNEYADAMQATFTERLAEARRATSGRGDEPLSGPRANTPPSIGRLVGRELLGGAACLAGEWMARLRRRAPSSGVGAPMPRPRQPHIGDHLGHDLRYALRGLRKNPGFTIAATLTLALGIGANTAVYSVVYSVVLRPLPYPDADRLVRIWPQDNMMKGLFERLVEQTESYRGASAYSGWGFTVTGEGDPESIAGALVSTNHFEVMGSRPALGRAFVEADAEPGAAAVIVLSDGLWKRRFGADPEILGKRVQIGNEQAPSRLVVGVMPPDYRPLSQSFEVWTPLTIDRGDPEDYYGSWYLQAVGRLHDGVTASAATDELRSALDRLGAEEELGLFQRDSLAVASVVSLHEWTVGDVRSTLLVLLGAVGLVLLIATTNVANLMLARGARREAELSVRRALGADRWRLVRQLVTESALLAALGAAGGVIAATWTLRGFRLVLPADMPRADAIGVAPATLAYTAAVSIVAMLLFGLIPALRVSRIRDAVPERSVSMRGGRQHQVLVAAEIAVSCVLLVCAGLFVRSLQQLRNVDSGFEASGVVTMRVTAPYLRYQDDERRRQFHFDVVDSIARIPIVETAGSVHLLPLGVGNWSFPMLPDGFVPEAGQQLPVANFRVATPDYFNSMSIPLLRGRFFDDTDRQGSASVMLINQRLADEFWPGEDPVGKTIRLFGNAPNTVIGVVGDVRQLGMKLPSFLGMYKPFAQWPLASMVLTVRHAAGADAAPIVEAVQDAIWSIEPDAPVSEVRTMEEMVSQAVSDSRFTASLLSSFAVLALALGAIGVYGVLSYFVGLRTREIGIRMALGAAESGVLQGELRRGMTPVALGMVVGMAAAVAVARLLSTLLFEVGGTDPWTYLSVVGVLAATALAACYLPARRAAKLEPVSALRLH